MNIRVKIFLSVFLTVFFSAFFGVFMLIPFYYGHALVDLGRFRGAASQATEFFLLYSSMAGGAAVALHVGYKTIRERVGKTGNALLALGLISLFVPLNVYNTYANACSYSAVSVSGAFLGAVGNWDVKGFEWSDPGDTYSSGFSYAYQKGVITVWVGDWEHDYYQGITVGAVRQGSVWDLATAPWYDQTTYQPAPLHFEDKTSVVLTAHVRIDSQHRTGLGWTNWLFNPWFRVKSTYDGVTRERKMVWDIVWGWNSFAGFSNTQDFIDEDENLHLVFFVPEMAQTGEWKTYTIDLLDTAEQARNRLMPVIGAGSLPIKQIWRFDVNDLYLWSIDVVVEGFDYDSQFSVNYVTVDYTILGSEDSYSFVSSWDINE